MKFQSSFFKKCGIFGLVILLACVVSINVFITSWIIKVLQLNSNGLLENLHFVENGVAIKGSMWIPSNLISSHIQSQNTNMRISGDDILVKVGNSALNIKNNNLRIFGDNIQLENTNKTSYFNLDKTSLKTSIKELSLEGEANLLKSLQTKDIQSNPNSMLQLESRTNGLKMIGRKLIHASSPAGKIDFRSHGSFGIQANKSIILDSQFIKMPKLHQTWTTQTAHQLCLCRDGLLFAVPSRLSCSRNSSCK